MGTGWIGRIFGPFMLVWFIVLGILARRHGIAQAPGVLVAFSPLYTFEFLIHLDFPVSFAVLGAAFLAVTGGEAMYADMGHSGGSRSAWVGLRWRCPALMLNYFGQGAFLIRSDRAR